MEAVFHESTHLEQQGNLDEAAERRIEAQLKAISDRLDRQLADDLAEIRGEDATGRVSYWKKIAAIVFLLAFIGMALEVTVGESFVFFYSNAYKSSLPTLFALTLPAFAIFWFRLEKQQHALSGRYPTWTVRWLVMFPVVVLLSSTMLVLSPFGWSALGGWVFGSDAPPLQAKVLTVEEERFRSGKCDQKAKLDFNGTQTNICIEGRIAGPAPKVGDTVSVKGRRSFLGLFIDEIHVMKASRATDAQLVKPQDAAR